jgi:hypothetical protein
MGEYIVIIINYTIHMYTYVHSREGKVNYSILYMQFHRLDHTLYFFQLFGLYL